MNNNNSHNKNYLKNSLIESWKKNEIHDNKLAVIKDLFPHCFSDNELNIDALKQELKEINFTSNEGYGLNWIGKAEAKAKASNVSNDTLRPDFDRSINFDESQNIIIEGDNLDVLKTLQKSYFQKIDVIYIDPPYNTGNDFVYNDSFAEKDKDYKLSSGQIDSEGNKTTSNQKTDGRYHTNWLNMMYPRLLLARNLLKDDGVIFISIDDNEQARLKLLCDEVFGEENFIGNIIWHARRGGGNDAKNLAKDHEYILCISKQQPKCKLIGKLKDLSDFKYEDEYLKERGKYNLQQFDRASLTYTLSLDYPITCPDGSTIYPGHVTKSEWEKRRNNTTPRNDWRWMMSEETFNNAKKDDFIIFKKSKNGEWNVRVKSYQLISYKGIETERFIKLRSILNDDFGITRTSTIEIEKLGLKHAFSYPKPSVLIKNLIKYFNNKDAIILDFFAGSGTTGHAVMDLNKEDGGNRKFILVQLPELIENNDQFKYISDITRERIKRSIEMFDYKEKGFKFFKLDSTNINDFDIDTSSKETIQQSLFKMEKTFKDNRSINDILYELMLRTGIELNTKFELKKIDNNNVFIDESNTTIFAIDNTKYQDIQNTIKTIYKQNNNEGGLVVYFKDENFDSDQDKINTIKQVESISNNIEVEII